MAKFFDSGSSYRAPPASTLEILYNTLLSTPPISGAKENTRPILISINTKAKKILNHMADLRRGSL
jgi:hypothetical protein